jgi:hypothetical protein
MRAFLAAMIALVVFSFGADYALQNAGYSAQEAFSLEGVSLPAPREQAQEGS